MSTTFIIKHNLNTTYTFIDGIISINPIFNYHIINIADTTNKILLTEYIYNNINILFDDILLESKINNLIIKFDPEKCIEWTNYKTLIQSIIKTKNEIEFYPSKNIMYIGNMIYMDCVYKECMRLFHGNGTIFYDKLTNNIMYNGDFNNGLFDGIGVFYSTDNNISITCNNIVNGIPKDKGQIKINYPNYELIKEIDFYNIWNKLNIITNENIIKFVKSNKFVDTITKLIWTNQKSLDDYQFEIMHSNNKLYLLYSKIKIIDHQMTIYRQSIKQLEYDNFMQFSIFLFLFFILIICNMYILYRIE